MRAVFLFQILAICWLYAPVSNASYLGRDDVETYIDQLVEDHEFSRAALEQIFAEARHSERIIDLISRPAERRLVWHEYREILVDEPRIRQGLLFWDENLAILEKASDRYGVPIEIIVAIIGVETRYGRITGGFSVVNALATLGFDYPPRAKFFRGELTQLLLLAREEGKDPMSLKGSYAGAMGYGQFIPSSYRNYAIDFDEDGVRDIWTNKTDAIGSVANYFARHGWSGSMPTVLPATVATPTPELLDLANASLKPTRALGEWQALGVVLEQTEGVHPESWWPATLLRLEQAEGADFWLGFEDFYVVTRYNHSRLYAMAVLQLSQAIRERREAG